MAAITTIVGPKHAWWLQDELLPKSRMDYTVHSIVDTTTISQRVSKLNIATIQGEDTIYVAIEYSHWNPAKTSLMRLVALCYPQAAFQVKSAASGKILGKASATTQTTFTVEELQRRWIYNDMELSLWHLRASRKELTRVLTGYRDVLFAQGKDETVRENLVDYLARAYAEASYPVINEGMMQITARLLMQIGKIAPVK